MSDNMTNVAVKTRDRASRGLRVEECQKVTPTISLRIEVPSEGGIQFHGK